MIYDSNNNDNNINSNNDDDDNNNSSSVTIIIITIINKKLNVNMQFYKKFCEKNKVYKQVQVCENMFQLK